MINFGASIKADNSYFKYSNSKTPQEDFSKIENFISLPIFNILLPDDEFTISAKRNYFTIQGKHQKFDTINRTSGNVGAIMHDLMIYTISLYNGNPGRQGSKSITEELKRLYLEKVSKQANQ